MSDSRGDNSGEIRLTASISVRESDLRFEFVSSGGPGGQNVNRRATKAQLRVDVDVLGLDEDAQKRLARLAGQRLTAAGELVISSDRRRSQRRNRADCIERLRELVLRASERPRTRRPTRPTAGSVLRRLEAKRRRSGTKRLRQPPDV